VYWQVTCRGRRSLRNRHCGQREDSVESVRLARRAVTAPRVLGGGREVCAQHAGEHHLFASLPTTSATRGGGAS